MQLKVLVYKTCYFLKKQDEVFQMDVKQML